MVNRGINIILGFGAIIAIGMTIAIYKIMTMPDMTQTFLAIMIAATVAVCAGFIIGISYLVITVNHRRRLFKIDTDAKQIALDQLRDRQYVVSETFDTDYAKHILDVLHGHVIETKRPKAIEKPGIIIPPQMSRNETHVRNYEDGDNL
jgi:hypothetical protein